MRLRLALVLGVFFVAGTASAQTPFVVQYKSDATATGGGGLAISTWKVKLPTASPGGAHNCIVAIVSAGDSTTTLAVSDDKSDTFGSSTKRTTSNNTAMQTFRTTAGVTAGASQLTITNSTNATLMTAQIWELGNVATNCASDGENFVAPGSLSTTWTAGSITTTAANDIVLGGAYTDNFTATSAPIQWTAGGQCGGLKLVAPDDGNFKAMEDGICASTGAVSVSVTTSLSSQGVLDVIAIKAGAGGNDLTTTAKIRGVNIVNAESPVYMTLSSSTNSFQFYATGNEVAVEWTGTPVAEMTSLTTTGLTWHSCAVQHNPSGTVVSVQSWYAATTPGTLYSVSVALSGVPSSFVLNFFDLDGVSSFDQCQGSNGNSAATSGAIAGPVLTPAVSGEIVLAVQQEEGQTITAASPCVYDAVDVGVYSVNALDTDEGLCGEIASSTSTINISWTYSQYEAGGTQIGNYASQAIAFKPTVTTIANQFPRLY